MSWPAVDLYGPVDYDHATRVGLHRRHSSTMHEIDLHILSEQYESLDYEMMENQLYKQAEDLPSHHLVLWKKSINRWVICFLIGVSTALVASMIDIMVHYSAVIKFDLVLNYFFDSQDNNLVLGLLAWIALNCCFVLVAAVVVLWFAGPVASGSGIPQIKCFLNGVSVPGVVRLKTIIAKAFGVAFSVAGGLSVGKEGPMIHSGAVLAAGISQGRCKTIPIDFKLFEYFRNDREKRDFVSAGAAAGVAAAFGAPIGGVLFSLEEGSSFWNQSLTWRIFFASMVSSFTLSIVLSTFYQQPGSISWSGLANFGTFENIQYNVYEIFFYLVMGAAGGLFGAFFNHINYRLTVFRNSYVKKKWQKLLEILIVASMSATVAFMTIFLVDDCRPFGVNPNITNPVELWCPDGHYSAVASLYFRTPEESVKQLFHSPVGSFRPLTLLVFAVGYFFLTTWTYGLQVPSGLFIPCLLTGAAWGRLVGIGIEALFPDVTGLDPGKYALAGAAAMLGGVVRMTISLTAIIMEATRDITFGLPIMLILMLAKWVGDYFNEGLYDIHIQLAGVPLLGWDPPRMSGNILAKEVMCPELIVFEPVEKVGRVYDTLTKIKHHGFAIVDQIPEAPRSPQPTSTRGIMKVRSAGSSSYGKLEGLILRKQLVTLLQHRMFSEGPDSDEFVAGSIPVTLKDFSPSTDVKLEHLTLSAEDRECYIDFRPYMNSTPFRVPVEASLTLMFQLFRGLGLRYLMVVDDENGLVGMVTRKDLARFREMHHHYRYKVEEIYISRE